jgi:hypothetical protein
VKVVVPIVAFFAFALQVQAGESSVVSPACIETGVLVGRDGAALGPSVMVEGHPCWAKSILFQKVGVYAYAGTSSVSGYQDQGATANFSDRTLGIGVDWLALHFWGFSLGPFYQIAYYGSKVHATYVDPQYGVTVNYRSTDKGPLMTLGVDIEHRIWNGGTAFGRFGRDFGDNFATDNAGGFSVNGGVKIDPLKTFQQIRNVFR